MENCYLKHCKQSCVNQNVRNQQVFNETKMLYLNNVMLINNRGWGGAIYCSYGRCVLLNVTVSNNYYSNYGGGIQSFKSNLIAVNSIIWNNFPDQVSDTSTSIFYSDVMGGWQGTGNIDIDPVFMDTAIGDYRLHTGSPCIDAGIHDTTIIYNKGQDTLIIPYIPHNGSGPDMGAYEFGPPVGITEDVSTPVIYTLKQNYPNPFNPSTKIKFTLPKSEKVKIEVFNLLGQKIETLLNNKMPAGSHEIEFTAKNLPSGVYLYRIETDGFKEVRKMILLK